MDNPQERIGFLLHSKERLEKQMAVLERDFQIELNKLRQEIATAIKLRGEGGDEETLRKKVEEQLREILRQHPKGKKAREIALEIDKIRKKLQQIEKILNTLTMRRS